MEFRSLRANEVECRIGQIAKNGSGLSLLLYKDARADMNLLDEVLGTEDWQCEYDVINGQLFCTVMVWSKKHDQWISKQDVGMPSNMEAEKGRASDAFKRACFKLGIGRELYTAPRIWVYSDKCNIRQGQSGRYQCYDSFSVSSMLVTDHRIEQIEIRNDNNGQVVFQWVSPEYAQKLAKESEGKPSQEQLVELSDLVTRIAKARNVSNDVVLENLMGSKSVVSSGVKDKTIRTAAQAATAINQLKAWAASIEKE